MYLLEHPVDSPMLEVRVVYKIDLENLLISYIRLLLFIRTSETTETGVMYALGAYGLGIPSYTILY